MGAAHPFAVAQEPQLDAEAFARAFPFYLQVDRALCIGNIGRSLEKLIGPVPIGTAVSSLFRVVRPAKSGTFQDWEQRIGELWTLVSTAGQPLTLRGSCERGPGGTLLLLVTPVLQSLAEQHQLELNFADFAKHDASGDALILAQTTRMSAADAERMSHRLRQRTEQLTSILELSTNGFISFDSSQHVMQVNSAALEILGMDRASALDMTLQRIDDWIGQQLTQGSQTFRPLQTLVQVEGVGQHLTLHLGAPRSRVLQVDWASTSEGGAIFYFRDVTHETEVDRMKSEFLSSAAHELRTPMASIFGFTELLIKRPYPPQRQAEMLKTIHRQSGRMVHMINELLDLARIEERRGLDLNVQPISLRSLVTDSIKGLMRSDNHGAVCMDSVPDVQVRVDNEKMQLALGNLLGNAVKYSPAGGAVQVSARTAQENMSHFAVIQVRDNGIGMSPDQAARAFERFYRADSSGNTPGTGLGLSLVKEIAELHQGRATIDSALGEGTTASLWIPLA